MPSRIKELENLIKEAQETYYAGEPSISDDQYDAYFDELKSLDPFNELITKVGTDLSGTKLKKLKHEIPMGSQNKVNTEKEFLSWVQKTKSDRFVVQEKLDGLSVELVYRDGKLLHAVTRGDSVTGEDITHNVQHMKNVFIKLLGVTGSFRGEIILPKSSFDKYFKGESYSNPRNASAGVSRREDYNPLIKHLMVIYYDCIIPNKTFEKESDKIEYMKSIKLSCVRTIKCSANTAIEWYRYYEACERADLDYEIDGLVVKVNNLDRQVSLGEINSRPKGQVAWKFKPEMRKSRVLDVSWDVGKTGRITPVAELEPVSVGGVTISRATLHNYSNLKKLGVYIGADVLIYRAGDVIPAVHSVLVPDPLSIIGYARRCPICSTYTEFDGEFLMCPNKKCPAKYKGDIEKWITVLGIDQVGPAFVETALANNLIKDPADLYTLSTKKISVIPGYGASSAKTIVDNINSLKLLPLPKFLGALNINNIGVSTFESLERAGYDTLEKVRKAHVGELAKISGVGRTTAEQIASGVKEKEGLIDKLISNGIEIKKKVLGKLTGKSFCFTGELSIKRSDAMKLVEDLGGEVKTTVGKDLTYLIQASATSTSSKSRKAEKYGTRVIGEKEFFDLVEFSFDKLKRRCTVD